MRISITCLLATPLLLLGCTSSPRSQDMVRRSTAAVTRTVASDVKGAALGIRDGLRHTPDNAPSADPVDINSASKSSLADLPGITPSMATQIIQNRPYRHTSDLVHRRLLPKAIYDKLAPRLVAH